MRRVLCRCDRPRSARRRGSSASRALAPAQPKVTEVLIGSVLPLTGNFASLGQQYLWAAQTVEDIVNNDYADIQVPLGPGKGLPGLGGVPIKFIVRDDQSRGEQARTIVEQLISVNKVHWINARRDERDHVDPPAGGGELRPADDVSSVRVADADREGTASGSSAPAPTTRRWSPASSPSSRSGRERGGPTDLKTIALFTCDNLFCQDNRKVATDLGAQGRLQHRARPHHQDRRDDARLRSAAPAGGQRRRALRRAVPGRRRWCSRTTPSARATCRR